MIKLINKLTGGEMWVADYRVDKYLEAGHKLASLPVEEPKAPEVEKKTVAKKVTPKRKTRK